MSTLGRLRTMLSESKPNFEQFKQQLNKTDINVKDLDLLLRKAVQSKCSSFHLFCDVLIKKGAKINFSDSKDKISTLMVACAKGNSQIVRTLLSYEAVDLLHTSSQNSNAAFSALDNKSKEDSESILRMLLQRQPTLVNIEAANQTLLTTAINKTKVQVVKLLLEKGVNVNQAVADSGNTPLHEVVKQIKSKKTKLMEEILKMLLLSGADYNRKNNQQKNLFDYADKFEGQLRRIVDQIEEQHKSIEVCKKVQKSKDKVLLVINTNEQINKVKKMAQEIYSKSNYKFEEEEEESQNISIISSQEDDQKQIENPTFLSEHLIIEDLQVQINDFQKDCWNDYNQAKKDIKDFQTKFKTMIAVQKLELQMYGSFATGLWLKHCDIDYLLVPQNVKVFDISAKMIEEYLDKIIAILKKTGMCRNPVINKKIRVPMIRAQINIEQGQKTRKIDITIMDRNHNGRAITHYINDQLKIYPLLRPMFYVIKSLSHQYKLNDPKKGGIRTYAIIIMLLSRIVSWNQSTPGKFLLDFLYYFGFYYDYNYQLLQEDFVGDYGAYQERQEMVLHIEDPINPYNNVGKNAKAYELQKMFRTAYIALHANLEINDSKKLQFLFDTKKIMLTT